MEMNLKVIKTPFGYCTPTEGILATATIVCLIAVCYMAFFSISDIKNKMVNNMNAYQYNLEVMKSKCNVFKTPTDEFKPIPYQVEGDNRTFLAGLNMTKEK